MNLEEYFNMLQKMAAKEKKDKEASSNHEPTNNHQVNKSDPKPPKSNPSTDKAN